MEYISMIEQLPTSVFILITSFLDGNSIAFLETASKKIEDAITINQDVVYRTLAKAHAWIIQNCSRQEWKKFYRMLMTGIQQSRLLIAGGSPSLGFEAYDIVESFEIRGFQEQSIPSMNVARDAVSIVSDHHSNSIFALGGWNYPNSLKSMECYQLSEEKWKSSQSMNTARCFLGGVSDGRGNILATGGGSSLYRGAECYNSVEIFNIESKTWKDHSDMLYHRCGHVAVLGDYGSSIYCLGGYGGGTKYWKSVERLDLHTNIWHGMAEMEWPRSGLGAGFGPDGCLYAVGGSTDGTAMLSSVERFDPQQNIWETITSMQNRRGYTSATFGVDGYLYVAGGSPQHENALDTMERLDIRTGKWEICPSSLSNTKVNAGMSTMIPLAHD